MNLKENNLADPYLIDDYAPFRDSKLWNLQRNYFKTKGLTAWQGEVPFYISSNAFIAYQYAQLVLSTITDILEIHPEYKNETFYIAELGAGVGKFSFYFLKALFRFPMPKDLKICYIMTDMVEKNKTFWEQNEYFQSFAQEQRLQFKLWNIEQEGNPLSELSSKAPLIVIANYVFDCTKQDVFEVKDNTLDEIQVQIKSRYKHYDQEKSEYLKELKFEYLNKSKTPSYSDLLLNSIVEEYAAEFSEQSYFTVPLGAIAFINQLEQSLNNNYIIFCGDKGITSTARWENVSQKEIFSYEGCYAFLFNFDILSRYLKAKGGDSLLTQYANTFKICLYSSNLKFSNLPKTRLLFEHTFERFCADEFCYLNESLQSNCEHFSLKALIGYLRLSQWDMTVYDMIHDRFTNLLEPLEVQLDSDIVTDLKKVENHVYYYPGMSNIYNQLGIVYQVIDKPEKAIELYQKALQTWGETTEPHHNLGVVYEKIGDKNKALYHYKRSIALNKTKNPNTLYAKKRIQSLEGHPFREAGKIAGRALLVCSLIVLALYYMLYIL